MNFGTGEISYQPIQPIRIGQTYYRDLNHASYDANSLRRAITLGLDPASESLDRSMPRWSMSTLDLDDLVTFLQQSHDHG